MTDNAVASARKHWEYMRAIGSFAQEGEALVALVRAVVAEVHGTQKAPGSVVDVTGSGPLLYCTCGGSLSGSWHVDERCPHHGLKAAGLEPDYVPSGRAIFPNGPGQAWHQHGVETGEAHAQENEAAVRSAQPETLPATLPAGVRLLVPLTLTGSHYSYPDGHQFKVLVWPDCIDWLALSPQPTDAREREGGMKWSALSAPRREEILAEIVQETAKRLVLANAKLAAWEPVVVAASEAVYARARGYAAGEPVYNITLRAYGLVEGAVLAMPADQRPRQFVNS